MGQPQEAEPPRRDIQNYLYTVTIVGKNRPYPVLNSNEALFWQFLFGAKGRVRQVTIVGVVRDVFEDCHRRVRIGGSRDVAASFEVVRFNNLQARMHRYN